MDDRRERRNIKLTIEYDGTRYQGWQRQANGPTIQQALEEGIAQVVGHAVTLYGSGRTDAGVHALGQVANFHTVSRIPIERLPHAINANIPADIVVLGAEEVPPDFHARYSAKRKTYRYSVLCRPVRPAVGAAYLYWHRHPLDVAAMRQAAAWFVGEHDFAAFQSQAEGEGSVRTVFRSEWLQDGCRLDYYVTANGFLYNMVRAMVGTLLDVGSGKWPPEYVARLLESRERAFAGRTAPANGLCLMSVEYE